MAVNILEEARRPSAPLGFRVDDAVKVARGRRRRPEIVVGDAHPARQRHQGAVIRAAQPEFSFEVASRVPACARVRPRDDSPLRPVSVERVETPAHPLRAEVLADPMFDADVDQARRLATTVRRPVRSVARAVRTERPSALTSPGAVQRRRHRLTLRGQRVVVAAGFAISIALGGLVGSLMGTQSLPEHTTTTVVQPGDSLWSIASTLVVPGDDVRPIVEQIAELNELPDSTIASGQRLLIPMK